MDLKLRDMRKERGYSQADIGEVCGVSWYVVSSWERGEVRLPLEDAVKIADFLECTLDELAGRDFTPRKSYFDEVFDSMNEEGQRYLLKQARYAQSDPSYRLQRDSVKVPS